MNKHTPGPWSLGEPERVGEGLHAPIHAQKHGELAMVVWQMEDARIDRVRSIDCEANAHLIAAAPELLAALELTRENLRACQATIHLCGGFDPAYVEHAQAAMKVADAAMAKARGQS
ncbi:hypothetical protein V2L09_02270 [Pseudomonas alliivorans]|nr:hypothetical protein [Pseudomonas alliivorans]